MPEEKQKAPMRIKAIAVTAASAVALVSSILGLWFLAEDRLKSSIITSTENITQLIHRSTNELVELHHDDLMVRKRILAVEINDLKTNGQMVPRMLVTEYEALKDQISELERKKWLVE